SRRPRPAPAPRCRARRGHALGRRVGGEAAAGARIPVWCVVLPLIPYPLSLVAYQICAQRAERLAAVADGRLLRSRELGQGAVERRIKKYRIVAEAVRASRFSCNLPLDRPFGLEQYPSSLGHRDRADEPRGAPRDAAL